MHMLSANIEFLYAIA